MNLNPLKVIGIFLKNKQWIEYEPETIWSELDDKYPELPKGYPEFPRELKDMIMAIKLCLINDSPWKEWNAFEKVCSALNGDIALFETVQKPSVAELALTVTLMKKIKANEFNNEIKSYIASAAMVDGFMILPTVLEFAQNDLNKICKCKEKDRHKVKTAYQICKLKKEFVQFSDDDLNNDIVSTQCAKLMMVDKYISTKLNKGSVEKQAALFGYNQSDNSLPSIEIEGFNLHRDSIDDLSGYIGLNNDMLSVKAARDGIILKSDGNMYSGLPNDEIRKIFIDKYKKSSCEIGSIFRRMYYKLSGYSHIEEELSVRAREIESMAGRAKDSIYRAGSRFNSLLLGRLFK